MDHRLNQQNVLQDGFLQSPFDLNVETSPYVYQDNFRKSYPSVIFRSQNKKGNSWMEFSIANQR